MNGRPIYDSGARSRHKADCPRYSPISPQPDAIPASMVGREQVIDIGPMSGKSNVIYWLEKRGIARAGALVERIFRKAKASSTVLTEEEILAEVYQLNR